MIYYPAVLVIGAAHIFFCMKTSPVDDHSLSYADAIEVSKDVTDFCQEEKLRFENIYAGFLMRTYLSDEYAGYVKKEDVFTNTQAAFNESTRYLIQTNYENDGQEFITGSKAILLKRFEKNNCWSEIYRIQK